MNEAGELVHAATREDPVIVGTAVVNAGSDMAQLAPMVEQVEQRAAQSPAQNEVRQVFVLAHNLTNETQTRLLSEAPAPTTRLDSAIRPRVDNKTAQIHRHAACGGGSKTHSLWGRCRHAAQRSVGQRTETSLQ